jgi:hypothetical protein
VAVFCFIITIHIHFHEAKHGQLFFSQPVLNRPNEYSMYRRELDVNGQTTQQIIERHQGATVTTHYGRVTMRDAAVHAK